MKLSNRKNVEIFAAGVWHKGTPQEVVFTVDDLKAMVRNFHFLISKRLYEPYAKIGAMDPHKGAPMVFAEGNPAAAWPKNLRLVGDKVLCDLEDMQPDVDKWIGNKVFKYVSPEIDKPPQGKPHPIYRVYGPVLKAVSILGSNPPAVCGLKPIPPAATFAAGLSRITHHFFSELKTMNRQEALDYLASIGVTIEGINDQTPDAFIIACAQALKEANDKAMAGAGNTGNSQTTPQVPNTNGAGLVPSQIITKFSQDAEGILSRLEAREKAMEAKEKEEAAKRVKEAANAHKIKVHNFCQEMVAAGHFTPADVETDKSGQPLAGNRYWKLLQLDSTQTHSFSQADGATVQKTALEKEMDDIRAAASASGSQHTFTEKVKAHGAGKVNVYDKIRQDAEERQKQKASQDNKPLRVRLGRVPRY